MHPYFAKQFYEESIAFVSVDPDAGARTYYSEDKKMIGHTRQTSNRGTYIHYNAKDEAIGSSNTVRTVDPSNPAVQVHKDAAGKTIGYTKAGTFGNDRYNKKRNHFSAQDRDVGCTMSGAAREETHYGGAGNRLFSPQRLDNPVAADVGGKPSRKSGMAPVIAG